jgi:uncharacterized protein
MKTREGDLIESLDGLILDVKGFVHPSRRIVAFIRYFPDEKGKRRRNGATYGKVYSLTERYALLKERFPQYLVYDFVFDEMLCEVPVEDVKKRYDPVERLKEMQHSKSLDLLETKALKLAELLKEQANIPWSALGVSGSILTRLHTSSSDIDPIVYGVENCRKAHSTLQRLLKEKHSPFTQYTREDLKALFDFRSKDTEVGLEDFVRTESRKALQGKFMGTDYFVRFVKDWNEIDENYGDVQYKNVGYAKVRATIAEDSEAIFTPCKYRFEEPTIVEGSNQPITEIVSFRGRFCEQARKGETVVAQGKLESVTDLKRNSKHFRLLIGNKPSDYMIIEC